MIMYKLSVKLGAVWYDTNLEKTTKTNDQETVKNIGRNENSRQETKKRTN